MRSSWSLCRKFKEGGPRPEPLAGELNLAPGLRRMWLDAPPPSLFFNPDEESTEGARSKPISNRRHPLTDDADRGGYPAWAGRVIARKAREANDSRGERSQIRPAAKPLSFRRYMRFQCIANRERSRRPGWMRLCEIPDSQAIEANPRERSRSRSGGDQRRWRGEFGSIEANPNPPRIGVYLVPAAAFEAGSSVTETRHSNRQPAWPGRVVSRNLLTPWTRGTVK